MDSKRRDDLEQNELAKWLTAQYEDWIRPNSSWLGYAILGGLIVVAIIIGTARVNTWNQNAAWQQYYAALASANASDELELLANSTSSIVGAHARLALAQLQLMEGNEQVFIDRNGAIVLLERAIASFQQAQGATRDPMILQQAGFGLGQCWEILAAARVGDSDLAKAKEEYQRVIERWEDGFAGQRAKRQLARLQQPTTQMFLERTAAKVIEPMGLGGFRDPFDLDEQLVPGQIERNPMWDIFGGDFGTFGSNNPFAPGQIDLPLGLDPPELERQLDPEASEQETTPE